MTEEIRKRFGAINDRRSDLGRKIEAAARAVIPVLLDAQRANSAKELQELFFQLDATEQDLCDWMLGDPEVGQAILFEILTRPGRA